VEEQHALIIGRIFDAMGLTHQLTGQELTSEGLSGSRTYRVWFDGHDAVLKVTDPQAASWVRERGQRELSFYRILASQVPLLVPELLGSTDDAVVGTCLLLKRYISIRSTMAWPADDVLELARQIASLHAAFWEKDDELAQYPWLRDLHAAADAEAIFQAHDAWRALTRSERLSALFSPDIHRMLDGGLARVPALDAVIQAFPATLCHGDCHLGNILRDEHGHLLWADWSEVGVGAGPTDLSFLIQRANAEGASLSIDTLTAAYHRQLLKATKKPISLHAIQQVMEAFELRMRLLEWPHYLGGSSVEGMSAMLARITVLMART
jgi:Ser/Thr protein kinase RdoA (MazF antagonist)